MYRTKTCGELRLTDAGKDVVLAVGSNVHVKWAV